MIGGEAASAAAEIEPRLARHGIVAATIHFDLQESSPGEALLREATLKHAALRTLLPLLAGLLRHS